MRFSTRACVIVLIISFVGAGNTRAVDAVDYEYGAYYDSRSGLSKIVKYTTPRVVVTTMTLRMPEERLTFKESPKEKKLMYLEKTAAAEVNLKPYFASREWSPHRYNPDDIVLILHICNQEGDDLQIVPLERKYSFGYTQGFWESEKIVMLACFGRRGWGTRLYVHLGTREEFVICDDPYHIVSEATSPDGEHLLINWDHRILYDGIQVLPFYDPDPFFYSDPPDSPKYGGLKIWEEDRRRALEAESKPDVSWFYTIWEGRLAWVEGGKKFAIVDNRPAALLFHEKKTGFTSEILERSRSPELVIVNVEKVPTGDINQYAERIPLQIDYTKLGKEVDSDDLPWPVYDEKENVIRIQANCIGPTGRSRLETIAAIPVP
jgi:hypothetical protein